ncbi:hypothetical protein B0T10DRAFT_298495 [Thelonectria olida]|uniref:Uncharacterized protein n=1 Tax=Thelonectria olida TaxID=1576542 RepID=A0A9P8W9E9_9HYPO|nr:hypothetical protein B0T10DRAFT_298495 [Thelonectria olida]
MTEGRAGSAWDVKRRMDVGAELRGRDLTGCWHASGRSRERGRRKSGVDEETTAREQQKMMTYPWQLCSTGRGRVWGVGGCPCRAVRYSRPVWIGGKAACPVSTSQKGTAQSSLWGRAGENKPLDRRRCRMSHKCKPGLQHGRFVVGGGGRQPRGKTRLGEQNDGGLVSVLSVPRFLVCRKKKRRVDEKWRGTRRRMRVAEPGSD